MYANCTLKPSLRQTLVSTKLFVGLFVLVSPDQKFFIQLLASGVQRGRGGGSKWALLSDPVLEIALIRISIFQRVGSGSIFFLIGQREVSNSRTFVDSYPFPLPSITSERACPLQLISEGECREFNINTVFR